MHQGEIIAFYRKKLGLTQDKLGEGICSKTHISKIEKGTTDVSSEIITLLCKRLGIDISLEKNKFSDLHKKIYQWHDYLIKENDKQIERLKIEIEQVELLEKTIYYPLYQILESRYYLYKNDTNRCEKLLGILREKCKELPQFEMDMLHHVCGIFFIKSNQYQEALNYLKKINENIYNCKEYYYHLALTYFSLDFKVLSYSYASKALDYFREINHFKRIHDVKILMLMLIEDECIDDFSVIFDDYQKLLEVCNFFKDDFTKAKLYNNLAYQLYKREKFEESIQYYRQALFFKDQYTVSYLKSLHGYIRSGLMIDLSKKEIITMLNKGLGISKKIKNEYYNVLLKKYYLKLEDDESYYKYLEQIAFPFFLEKGKYEELENCGHELLVYYNNTGQYKKGINLAITLTKS
ncbi:helix-turn-helix domain-containing protein [Bacillus cereus]|uniref:helix-turn-helix domain-containing protein n=1 Tax=Bacillus cereus TaxID=1396 RepID=UPI0018F2B384|nr:MULTISPECIES: helix-turn-helix domain-containing protein [Bacillus]MBJ8059883.1 helix-turn-helix domain-containing protein [Bacillus cereus]